MWNPHHTLPEPLLRSNISAVLTVPIQGRWSLAQSDGTLRGDLVRQRGLARWPSDAPGYHDQILDERTAMEADGTWS